MCKCCHVVPHAPAALQIVAWLLCNLVEPPSSLNCAVQEGTAQLIDGRMSSDCEVAVQPTGASILQGDRRQRFSYMYTARAIWQPAASVCSVYTITIAIFPGFLAEDISSQQLGSWYPILLITAFNIADAAGKILPVQAQFAMQNRSLILNLCLARLLFLPAFYVAASQGFGPSVMALLTLALGLSNGYLTAVAMMLAPQGLQVTFLSPPAMLCKMGHVSCHVSLLTHRGCITAFLVCSAVHADLQAVVAIISAPVYMQLECSGCFLRSSSCLLHSTEQMSQAWLLLTKTAVAAWREALCAMNLCRVSKLIWLVTSWHFSSSLAVLLEQ